MKQFNGDLSPGNVSFQYCPFWIRVFNIPIKSRNSVVGTRIANEIGVPILIDAPKSGLAWDPFLRIRVDIDVTKPLMRGKMIHVEGAEECWVFFNPGNVSFQYCPFWIRVFNIPIKSRNSVVGTRIANEIGVPILIDAPKSGLAWDPFLRIRVDIDVTKPLMRGKMIHVEGVEEVASKTAQRKGSPGQSKLSEDDKEDAQGSNEDDMVARQLIIHESSMCLKHP
nr:hypothetical protein CFP56_66582 [Quercus suber]